MNDAVTPLTRAQPSAMDLNAPLDRVEIEGVSKRYGRRFALDDVSLTVRRGEPCALMGENGAGKSTLVQLVATALRPDAGRIVYRAGDRELVGRDLRRRFGLVTHQPMVYEELSALENVTHFARLGGLTSPRDAAAAMLDALGLDPSSRQPAGQFSRGMLARLSAARALVTGPELLLLDEAASGLDREGRRSLTNRVLELSPSTVVLMATHHVELAARVARHLVVLRAGRVGRQDPLPDAEDERRAFIDAALASKGA